MSFIKISVETENGRPVPDVEVVCARPEQRATLTGTTIEGGAERLRTGAEGQFLLPATEDQVLVIVSTEEGFGMAFGQDLAHSPRMVVQAWGSLEGVWTNWGRPVANHRLRFAFRFGEVYELLKVRHEVVTDAEGRFSFEHVPPTTLTLRECHRHPEGVWFVLARLEAAAGQKRRLEVATRRMTVTGQLVVSGGAEIDFASCAGGLSLDVDWSKIKRPRPPKELDTPALRERFLHEYWETTGGREYLEATGKGGLLDILADGSFIAESVASCRYTIKVSVTRDEKRVAEFAKVTVTVSDAESGTFDLGNVVLHPVVELKVGDDAPDFNLRTLDGQTLALADFRGKFVLLEFSASWCGYCALEVPHLKAVHEAHGGDERFVMITLSLDGVLAEFSEWVKSGGMTWPHYCLETASREAVTTSYGVTGAPAIFLIGPDGKIMAARLRREKIELAVAAALRGEAVGGGGEPPGEGGIQCAVGN